MSDTSVLGDGGVDERKLLQQILKKYDVRMWAGLNWLGLRSSDGLP
jgi:hypothetical protein